MIQCDADIWRDSYRREIDKLLKCDMIDSD
jgi:hypothetical protein